MYKILIGIILIMLSTACATPPQMGTGGYDPETQALLAIATQTGAAALISQTQAAQSATAQAIYAQQTAVSSYATGTAVAIAGATAYAQAEGTAVSATETAIYKPAALRQTEEAQAVLMQREALNTSATATAVKLQSNQDADAAKRWGLFWIGFMIFWGGIGAALVIGSLGYAIGQWRRPNVFEDSNGNIVALDPRLVEARNVRHVSRPVVIENQVPQIEAPVNNMKATTDTRTVSGSRNGRPHDWTLPEESPVKDETWQKLAVALLVSCVPFSREAVLDRTKRNWIYGRMSQPEYNAAYQFLDERNMVGGKLGENKLTPELYEFLENYVPPHEVISLPHPDEEEISSRR